MIGGLRRVSFTGVLVALTIVVLAGCSATGGGYITSATGEGNATFAFNGKCQNKTTKDPLTGEKEVAAEYSFTLQYNDHPADVKIHGLGGGAIFGQTCEELDDSAGDTVVFDGVYFVPGGPKEEEDLGAVTLEVTDGGEPGINGDYVKISLVSGPHDGYTNEGFVQGGNVQVH
jgi:hypothetical protein